jgi:hypothetical protein
MKKSHTLNIEKELKVVIKFQIRMSMPDVFIWGHPYEENSKLYTLIASARRLENAGFATLICESKRYNKGYEDFTKYKLFIKKQSGLELRLERNNLRTSEYTSSELLETITGYLMSMKEVRLSDIPPVLYDDLIKFISGKFVIQRPRREIIIVMNDFEAWIEKLHQKGLDYEINRNNVEKEK